MHHQTTQFSAQILTHTKQLITQLDEAGFPYNRDELIQLLQSFTVAHNNKDETTTVDHVQTLLNTTELLEHQFHDWQTARAQQTSVDEMKTLLGGFQTKTVASTQKKVRAQRTPVAQWYEDIGYVVDYLIVLVCIALVSTLVIGGTSYMWYMLIVMSLCTIIIMYAQWLVTKRGRVFVIVSLIGGWMMFLH